MIIRLTTLGGLCATGDGGELDSLLGRRMRAALFVYLAVERRVPRATLTAVFWPERGEDLARHALRQGLYDLRKALGGDWLDATTHEVRVSPDVRADVHSFSAALERGDPESAAKLYGGAFLDGMHLVDQRPWESWVDGRRAECARAFRRACRDWLSARRSAGDPAGAIEAAQRWVAPDPFDDEAQHHLIGTLADAGERTEAIRQYETYARLLEPDGLRPLDETVALIDRVRSEPAAWQGRPPESEPSTVPAASAEPATPVAPATPAAPACAAPAMTNDPATPAMASHSIAPAASNAHAAAGVHRRHPRRILAGIAAAVMLSSALWFVQPRWLDWPPPAWLAAESTRGEEAEPIVLADFGGPATDPQLGAVITDALRIDLLKAPVLSVLEPAEVSAILEQMQIEPAASLTVQLAREVALRAGAKAVLEGEIARAGTGYVLTAALRSTAADETLAAFRETARSPADVIPAIDRLSRKIRRQAGESLESVRAAPTLGRVTTSSLEALRLYTLAERAMRRAEYHSALSLLEETLEADAEFAMAWRLLAVTLSNTGLDRVREVDAARRAYELRQRLGPRERYLTEAEYHTRVTYDRTAAVEAYRRVLELDPDDPVALNNLALLYDFSNAHGAASELLERLVDGPRAGAAAFANLLRVRIAQGRLDEAHHVVERFSDRYPGSVDVAFARFWVLLLSGDTAGARAQFEPLLDDPSLTPHERSWAHDHMARLALWRGRLEEARTHFEAAEQIAHDAGSPYSPLIWRLRRAHAEVAVGDAELAIELLADGVEQALRNGVSPPERHHLFQATILGMAERPSKLEAVIRDFEAEVPPKLHGGYRPQDESARALLHIGQGDPEQAVEIFEQIRASYPCRYCFADHFGWALRRAGRLDDAAREWETALAWKDSFNYIGDRLTHHLWTLQRVPALYEQLGDTTRAIQHYRRLAELWDGADPELQPRVEHARRRIAALRAAGN